MQIPAISVVIPLVDHREQTFASLASFCAQSMGEKQVEVIVPTDGSDPALEREVLQAFPRVRLIQRPGLSIVPLYNQGAQAARGKYVFITEMHCIAEPDCLIRALGYLEQEELDCVCSNSTGINANRVAEGEQRIMEQDMAKWRSSDRCKVVIRGFLIRRDLWHEVGGFREDYDQFAALVMGRKLKQLGCKHGYAEQSLVHHYNQTDFEHLAAELRRYGYGECCSYHKEPPAESALICREWRKRNKIAKSPAMLWWHRCIQQTRLYWLQMVLNYVPLSRDAYFARFVKHWETAIRIGRLQYLAALDSEALTASNSVTPGHFKAHQQAA